MKIHASEKKCPLSTTSINSGQEKLRYFILQNSVFDSYAALDSTYRAMWAANGHMKQEKQFNQFYATKKRIKADSGSQMTFWYSGKVSANSAIQFAEARLSQCPVTLVFGHTCQILFHFEDQAVIFHFVTLPFNCH